MPDNTIHITERLALFESIINSSDDAIISKTLDGIITSWNKGAETLFGYTCNEIIGKHFSILIPPDRFNEETGIIEMIKQEKHVPHYETVRLKKDGSLIHISLSVSPLKDTNGNITGASKIARNITERKKFEEQLSLSEKIYRTIAAGLPGAGITIADRSGRFIFAEGEGLKNLGYTKEELENKVAKDAPGAAANELADVCRQKAFKGEDVSVDVAFKDFCYRMRYLPVRDDKDEIFAVMTISLDITDIKKAGEEIQHINNSLEKKIAQQTEQLENLNKELESFSFSVSHDLKAPLRIITAYSGILENDYASALDEEGKRMFNNIILNARRMGKLMNELLKLARLGRRNLVKMDTRMDELVNDVIAEQTELTGSHIEFKTGNLPPISCDAELMRQVWTNLLSNAIKYSRTQAHQLIEIDSFVKDNMIAYSVKDNGVGFDMNYSHKLFGVFQRLHSQSEYEGTGIGLALVQRIISKHGGNVWAEAEQNKGATFYFSLPVIN